MVFLGIFFLSYPVYCGGGESELLSVVEAVKAVRHQIDLNPVTHWCESWLQGSQQAAKIDIGKKNHLCAIAALHWNQYCARAVVELVEFAVGRESVHPGAFVHESMRTEMT